MDHTPTMAKSRSLPEIVTSNYPPLTTAMVNSQVEFDHAFRNVVNEPSYRGKRVVFVSGQEFLLTKFVPRAAYVQNS